MPDQNTRTNEKPRELILKLGQMITDRMGHTVTADDPEYWGLAGVVTDEMAAVAVKMKVRKPMTLAQLEKATGKSAAYLEPLLQQMSVIGLLEYNWENPTRTKQYVLPMFVPGCAEFTNMNEKQLEEHPELGRFFEQMSRLPLEKVTPMVPPGGSGVGMHVIPVEKAIEAENHSADVEHISHWLKKYQGKYAAGPCSCRLSRRTYDEGCADDPEDWCIGVGDMADYLVETGKGHYITYEKVLETLKRAEDNGFVHQITNIDGSDKIFAICNCNVNVCYALRTSQLFNTPNMSRSAYVAKVETQNCVACGRCVEHCPAGAVKLGQKLCTKSGPVAYPRQELPDSVKWGPEKWDENYRDNNRINCHESGTSPCKTACPAHVAVQGYLKMAAQGRYQDALALIKKENPFPAVCGRVCNRRCEEACTRGTVDQAVAIDEVKKFIAQQELDSGKRYIPPVVQPSNRGPFPQKIAIIGGGPAGLSCAYYLAEKGYHPTVFEREKEPGGMMMNGIPNFRLEKDVVRAEIDVLRQMGVEFRCGVDVGRDVTIRQLREQGYQGFYLAIGLQSGGSLPAPGADAEGVMPGIDLMRRVNQGETVALHGKVVVIGGGNIACDVARTAVRCGADSVDMYCLESDEEMPCGEDDKSEVLADGIHIHPGWGPMDVQTDETGAVKSIRFRKCLSVKNAEGRFAPVYDDGSVETAEAAAVLFCIGQRADWGDLIKDTQIVLNRNATAVADALTYQTAEPDVFVGGDIYTGQKFCIDAIAAGHEAAISLHRYVQPHSSLTIGRNPRHYVELNKNDVKLDSYDAASRQRPGTDAAVDAHRSFRDPRVPLTEEQVRTETSRCLGCGASIVDPNKCIGCGVCTTKCEFDAIHLFREHPECSVMRRSEDKMKGILPYMIKREFKIKFGKKGQ